MNLEKEKTKLIKVIDSTGINFVLGDVVTPELKEEFSKVEGAEEEYYKIAQDSIALMERMKELIRKVKSAN